MDDLCRGRVKHKNYAEAWKAAGDERKLAAFENKPVPAFRVWNCSICGKVHIEGAQKSGMAMR